MNKILKSFLIIGLGLGIFTACDDAVSYTHLRAHET